MHPIEQSEPQDFVAGPFDYKVLKIHIENGYRRAQQPDAGGSNYGLQLAERIADASERTAMASENAANVLGLFLEAVRIGPQKRENTGSSQREPNISSSNLAIDDTDSNPSMVYEPELFDNTPIANTNYDINGSLLEKNMDRIHLSNSSPTIQEQYNIVDYRDPQMEADG
uniref:Uncharacterized protein n=1 Tax=Panagrolaimus sp. ES5 TaxID=591445 RepID=A0AC34GHI3_9BILA